MLCSHINSYDRDNCDPGGTRRFFVRFNLVMFFGAMVALTLKFHFLVYVCTCTFRRSIECLSVSGRSQYLTSTSALALRNYHVVRYLHCS
jgi:hypothetical protein